MDKTTFMNEWMRRIGDPCTKTGQDIPSLEDLNNMSDDEIAWKCQYTQTAIAYLCREGDVYDDCKRFYMPVLELEKLVLHKRAEGLETCIVNVVSEEQGILEIPELDSLILDPKNDLDSDKIQMLANYFMTSVTSHIVDVFLSHIHIVDED